MLAAEKSFSALPKPREYIVQIAVEGGEVIELNTQKLSRKVAMKKEVPELLRFCEKVLGKNILFWKFKGENVTYVIKRKKTFREKMSELFYYFFEV